MEIAVLMIAIAFVLIAFFLIRVLLSLTKSLDQTQKTLHTLDGQLSELGSETKLVLNHTNEVLVDIHKKSQTLNPIFDRIEDAGQAASELSSTMIQVTSSISERMMDKIKNPGTPVMPKATRVASLAYFLVQKWKERKSSN